MGRALRVYERTTTFAQCIWCVQEENHGIIDVNTQTTEIENGSEEKKKNGVRLDEVK